jgi:hypothetical protein
MTTLAHSQHINVPATKVWEVVSDFGGVRHWHPMVETSPLLSDNNVGLGASRTCNFYDGNSVKELVTEYVDGEYMVVDILEGSMPMARAQAKISVRPDGDSACEVLMEMDYVVKYGIFGQLMDAMMMRRMMTGMLGKVLEGLEHHARTGEEIGKDFTAEAPRAAAA